MADQNEDEDSHNENTSEIPGAISTSHGALAAPGKKRCIFKGECLRLKQERIARREKKLARRVDKQWKQKLRHETYGVRKSLAPYYRAMRLNSGEEVDDWEEDDYWFRGDGHEDEDKDDDEYDGGYDDVNDDGNDLKGDPRRDDDGGDDGGAGRVGAVEVY